MKKLFFALSLLCTVGVKAQFTNTNVITGLPYPICFDIAPDGRYFVSCKGGAGSGAPANAQVRVFSSTGTFQANLWDFTDSVETYFERGVLGVTCDPNFATNHYVYVFYNHDSPAMIRVVRLTETAGVGSNPQVIFEVNDPYTAGNHSGGNIHFMPSDTNHLYISIGDRAVTSTAQNLTKWAGKLLRINKDGSIPTDNPFYDDGNPATGNDDRIWSYGHRNMFDFAFNTANDTLYGSENGLNTQDEMNLITKGNNYGWPNCEGTVPYLGGCSGYRAPLEIWVAPLPSVTGIMFYTSTVFSAYTNHLIMTDYNNGDVWDITLGNAPAYDQFVSRSKITALSTFSGLTDLAQGPEGCWYVIDGGYTAAGKLVKICPTGMGTFDYEIENAYKVFPNPANDLITVEGANIEQIQLVDLNGKTVMTTIKNTIDISLLSKGVYQLRVNNVSVEKVIKL